MQHLALKLRICNNEVNNEPLCFEDKRLIFIMGPNILPGFFYAEKDRVPYTVMLRKHRRNGSKNT
jgi:hypothetical protein